MTTTTTPTTALADLDFLPCPFCKAQLEPFGPSQSNHPRNGCWLSSVAVKREEFEQWNRRAAQPVAPSPQIAEVAELPQPWQERMQAAHPTSEAQYWPDSLKCKYMSLEIDDLRDAITASRRADITYTVDGVIMSPLEYISYLHDKIITPTPASAGQAAPVFYARQMDLDEPVHDWSSTVVSRTPEEAWNVPLYTAPAAQPAEGAGQAEASQAGRQYQRKVDEKIIARRDAEIASLRAGQAGQVAKPELTVWYGPMPESNGKSNFTAILMRKGGDQWDNMTDGITIDRSEYPDRVRYEADLVRYLLGELAERPFILDYDADKHSGYVAPTERAAAPAELTAAAQGGMDDSWKVVIGAAAALAQCHIENDDEREAMMEHVRKIITAIPKLDGAPK